METVTSLALAIDAKDHFTNGHSNKVAAYSALIAERMGLPEREVEQVHLGGLLHDIGKVGIPADILNKSGPLNPEEWEIMKEHVRLGDQLLNPLNTIACVREMVCHHHEMFDGSGYPDGLAGEQIPLGARIIAIADAYDTITSERTYKKARTPERGIERTGALRGHTVRSPAGAGVPGGAATITAPGDRIRPPSVARPTDCPSKDPAVPCHPCRGLRRIAIPFA